MVLQHMNNDNQELPLMKVLRANATVVGINTALKGCVFSAHNVPYPEHRTGTLYRELNYKPCTELLHKAVVVHTTDFHNSDTFDILASFDPKFGATTPLTTGHFMFTDEAYQVARSRCFETVHHMTGRKNTEYAVYAKLEPECTNWNKSDNEEPDDDFLLSSYIKRR